MILASDLKARVEKEVGTEICPAFFQKAEKYARRVETREEALDTIERQKVVAPEYCKLINKRMDKMQLNIFNMGAVE